MTTPEKFRRRQRIDMTLFWLLAIASVLYGVWDSNNAHDRDVCMANSFHSMSQSLTTRGEVAAESARLQQRKDAIQNRVIQEVSASKDTADVVHAFNKFNRHLDHVRAEQKALIQKRQHTKIPPFPSGKCQ